MWKGEPSKLLVVKGYWKAVGAKLLRVIDETICSILTDDTNCCYLDRLTFEALVARCKPAKKEGFGDGVSAASPMIKSTKGWRRRRREFTQLELHTFPSSPSFRIILKSLLDYREDNLVILVIKSIFPYQRLILPY